jgi:hypothetical protein
MRRLWLIPLVLCIVIVPAAVVLASNGGRGFDGVVSSVESRYHVHATRIPFMGVVSLISRAATHGGVGGLRVAEIENFSEPVDGDDLSRMVEEKLGKGWDRMIRETSKKGGEQTLIFVRQEGNRMGMFIVDKDGNEMDVVQISVDPDHLSESIGKYDHGHHSSVRSDEDESAISN